MLNSSIQLSLIKIMGRANSAVLRLSLDKMADYDFPPMEEYLSKTKDMLMLKEFSCNKNEKYRIRIRGCPWSSFIHKNFPEDVLCPLVMTAGAIIEKDAKRDISYFMEYEGDGIDAYITESSPFKFRMEDPLDILGYFHTIDISMQHSIHELIGVGSGAVMRHSMDTMTRFDLPSVEEFISDSKDAIGLKKFNCKKGTGYQIRIIGCPWAVSTHRTFKQGIFCPFVFIIGCILKKETGIGVDMKINHIDDGVEAEIQSRPESWLELLMLAKRPK